MEKTRVFKKNFRFLGFLSFLDIFGTKTEYESTTQKHMKTSHTYRTKATDEEQHIKTEK